MSVKTCFGHFEKNYMVTAHRVRIRLACFDTVRTSAPNSPSTGEKITPIRLQTKKFNSQVTKCMSIKTCFGHFQLFHKIFGADLTQFSLSDLEVCVSCIRTPPRLQNTSMNPNFQPVARATYIRRQTDISDKHVLVPANLLMTVSQ